MNVWDFFETKLYINLEARFDRLIDITKELERVGITDAVRIPGIILDDRPKGFNESQHLALITCKGNSVVLEDDAVFSDFSHLQDALNELPDDWDLLYLGANVVGTDLCHWPEPEYFSPHLRRVKQAWTTHAIAYSEQGLKKILDMWDYKNNQIFDDFLRCAIESKLNAYIIYPMIANQKPGFSDIWRCPTDYGFFNVWKQ